MTAHTKDLGGGQGPGIVFFENMGRSERLRRKSTTRVVEAKAGILVKDSLLSLIVVTICENDDFEAT